MGCGEVQEDMKTKKFIRRILKPCTEGRVAAEWWRLLGEFRLWDQKRESKAGSLRRTRAHVTEGPSCISGEGEGSELRANRQTLWFSDLTQIGA